MRTIVIELYFQIRRLHINLALKKKKKKKNRNGYMHAT